VRDGRAVPVDQPTAAPACTISLDTEAFVVLATGRRTAAQVAATVEGDTALAAAVLANFNMMI
jgi:hypothetical protein